MEEEEASNHHGKIKTKSTTTAIKKRSSIEERWEINVFCLVMRVGNCLFFFSFVLFVTQRSFLRVVSSTLGWDSGRCSLVIWERMQWSTWFHLP